MPRTQVSFATCTLYNLNEPRLRLYSDDNGWSQLEYDRKLRWTAETITSVKADVWAFQELWHVDSLEHVFSTTGVSEEYTLLVPSNQAGQRIVCAGAVRSDILVGEPEWIDVFPEHFKLSSGGDEDQTADITVKATDSHVRSCISQSGPAQVAYISTSIYVTASQSGRLRYLGSPGTQPRSIRNTVRQLGRP